MVGCLPLFFIPRHDRRESVGGRLAQFVNSVIVRPFARYSYKSWVLFVSTSSTQYIWINRPVRLSETFQHQTRRTSDVQVCRAVHRPFKDMPGKATSTFATPCVLPVCTTRCIVFGGNGEGRLRCLRSSTTLLRSRVVPISGGATTSRSTWI